jgi:hypothetical protein
VISGSKEPEDHEYSRIWLIPSAHLRSAVLHEFKSWFTEAGANCNAVCARFEDCPDPSSRTAAIGEEERGTVIL